MAATVRAIFKSDELFLSISCSSFFTQTLSVVNTLQFEKEMDRKKNNKREQRKLH